MTTQQVPSIPEGQDAEYLRTETSQPFGEGQPVGDTGPVDSDVSDDSESSDTSV
jgi:hypothetical protein